MKGKISRVEINHQPISGKEVWDKVKKVYDELQSKDLADSLHQMEEMLERPVTDLSARGITTTFNEKGEIIMIDEAPFTPKSVTQEETIVQCGQEGKSFEAVVHFADSLVQHHDVLSVKLNPTTAVTEVGEDIIDLFEQVSQPVSKKHRRAVNDVILGTLKDMVKEAEMEEIKEVESKTDLPVAITGAGVGGITRERFYIDGASAPRQITPLFSKIVAEATADFYGDSVFSRHRRSDNGFRRYAPVGTSAKVKAKRRKAVKKKHKR